MTILEDWIQKQSKFISIKPGETFEGTFLSYAAGQDRFGETIFYKFDGDKTWSCKNITVARQMKDMSAGDTVKIARSPKDDKGHTQYVVGKVGI